MLEWLKRHAWKACIRQKRIGGSNPPYSAKKPLQVFCSGFFCRRNGGLLRRCKMNRSIISGASSFIYSPLCFFGSFLILLRNTGKKD